MNAPHASPRHRGLTILELIIAVSIIGILVTIAIPAYQRPRERVQASLCINNLRVIRTAKQLWAIEHNQAEGDTPSLEDLLPYLRSEAHLKCPSVRGAAPILTEHYEINAVGTDPACLVEPETHVVEP